MDLNFAADGYLRELSAEEACETIENFALGQKEWDKPFKAITEQELASLRAQANELFGNEKDEGERMRHSIEVKPHKRKMIQNPDKPDDPTAMIIEPLSKMTKFNKKKYFSDIRVTNFLLQGIPTDIYKAVDACKTAKQM
ncbi:hypothetical protein Tco_0673511 [Tanacetum coccineum]